MPLPFLKKKHEAAVIVKHRVPDEKPEQEQVDEDAPLRACARDMIIAIQEDNPKALAAAIRAAFIILEAEPHEEPGEIEEQEIKEE